MDKDVFDAAYVILGTAAFLSVILAALGIAGGIQEEEMKSDMKHTKD